jgi:hypothetical protein
VIRWTSIALAACLFAAAFSSGASCPANADGTVTISIDNPQNGTVVGSELNISGTAFGPEGQELSVSVSIDAGQSSPACGNTSWSYRWSPATEGPHIIEAVAAAGNETAHVQVTVYFCATQPQATIGGHDPVSEELSLAPGENITLSVNLSGPAAGAIINWFYNGTELRGDSGHLRINITTPGGYGGNITVEARLTQNGSVTDSTRWNITVARPQGPPGISAFLPAEPNISVATQEKVLFNLTASDPDGDALNITWLVDGKPRASGMNMTSFEISFNESGDHCITASVSDGHNTANVTWNLTVVDNYVPGLMDIAPCVVYLVLGLFMGIGYGMRTRRTTGPLPS